MAIHGKLLGPQTQQWLENEMRLGDDPNAPRGDRPEWVGLSYAFRINGDWELYGKEASYSAPAYRYKFNGKEYAIDDSNRYRLYSPIDLTAKPTDYAVDDDVRAIYNGRWEIVGGGLVIHRGKLDETLAENAEKVRVMPNDGDKAISVTLPPYRIQTRPQGTMCRYFRTSTGYEMLDTDCGE